jgi:hypothetical protein
MAFDAYQLATVSAARKPNRHMPVTASLLLHTAAMIYLADIPQLPHPAKPIGQLPQPA